MAQNVRGIGESRPNVPLGKLRVGAKDFARKHSVGKAADQGAHRDSGSFNAWVPVVKIFCDGDVVLPPNSAHRDFLVTRGKTTTVR